MATEQPQSEPDLVLDAALRERALGCNDSAVAGGFAALASQARTALLAAGLPEDRCEKALERVRAYADLTLPERRKLLNGLIRWLDPEAADPKAEFRAGAPLSPEAPLTELSGVGKRVSLLEPLGLATVGDLLRYYPLRHEDRTSLARLADLRSGMKQPVCVEVTGEGETQRIRGGKSITKVPIADASGRGYLVWFNQSFRQGQFKVGTRLYCYGKARAYGGITELSAPECELVREEDSLSIGRIVPVYGLTKGLGQWLIRKLAWQALERALPQVEEPFPLRLLAEEKLMPLGPALRQIHYPDSFLDKEQARKRLAFEELLTLQLVVARRRQEARKPESPVFKLDEGFRQKLKALLPFQLTNAQKRAINDLSRDMCSPHPMNRLLHGDVGSGKTLVACAAMLLAAHNGFQSAIMAPTELLAEQHAGSLADLLEKAGLTFALLTGSQPQAERKRLLAALAEGKLDVAIGTHALFQKQVEFASLGLLVVDEQHRFGVAQREALRSKGGAPHMLAMSATPIPRTLALTVYGDLDVSTLDELPAGRKPVETKLYSLGDRRYAYAFVVERLQEGEQAFIVCPLIEGSEALEAEAATELAEKLRATYLKGFEVGLAHGRLPTAERQAVMERFRSGELRALVSTTVIEVGVDVPNATVMVVENAERFGLAQLHQLRGRVGRGASKSYCLLVSDLRSEESRTRLRALEKYTDGFKLAELDLELRGPGEFFGTRQHGLPDLKIANLFEDTQLLRRARELAFDLIEADPELAAPEHAGLKRLLEAQQERLARLASSS